MKFFLFFSFFFLFVKFTTHAVRVLVKEPCSTTIVVTISDDGILRGGNEDTQWRKQFQVCRIYPGTREERLASTYGMEEFN